MRLLIVENVYPLKQVNLTPCTVLLILHLLELTKPWRSHIILGNSDYFINRYNVCIMAYGQTGSGKTHTMLGSHELDMEIDSESLNKDEGIIPRSAKELFR